MDYIKTREKLLKERDECETLVYSVVYHSSCYLVSKREKIRGLQVTKIRIRIIIIRNLRRERERGKRRREIL